MATGLSGSNQDSMPVIRFYVGQPAQVSRIGVYGEDTGGYFNAALATCPFIYPGELVGNPAATLSEPNHH